MKHGTLSRLCAFILVFAAFPAAAQAANSETRMASNVTAAYELTYAASHNNTMRDDSGRPIQMASAVQNPTQLLPDEDNLPADLSAVKAAQIVVYKSERRMDLLDASNRPIRSYRVSLGKNPVGTKERYADYKTPEGRYYISWRNPNSDYHLSLKISYPDKNDLARAKRQGVDPGGDIFIHGMPNGQGWKIWKYSKSRDWTNGCIAVNDDEMNEIWNLVPDNTPIIIKP